MHMTRAHRTALRLRRLRDRLGALSSEDGFTMIIALGVLMMTALLITLAFVAVEGDTKLTNRDVLNKKAYYAAQAGLNDYLYHLTQDGNYLTYCTSPTPANAALNQESEGTTHKALVPETTDEKYAIDLLPAEDSTEKKCNTSNVVATMIEQSGPAAGSFRIESTGFATGGGAQVSRSIVATIKNLNFLSFVWYDVFETGDPVLYGAKTAAEEEYYGKCGSYYEERHNSYHQCSKFNNYFITGESVNGPMHTEDHLGVCGEPHFGRNSSDRIEFGHSNGGDLGYSSEEAGGCSGSPKFLGTHILPEDVQTLQPPPGDEELEHLVSPAYHFTGKTEITLEGAKMTIVEHAGTTSQVTKTNVSYPENGIIYVSGGCSQAYSPFGPVPGYTEDGECGNVYVQGEYTKALTIASQNDVVIAGNITTPVSGETPTSTALLGLIANNFVRVKHELSGTREKAYTGCGTSKNTNTKSEFTIYAAVLAVKHSFIVDNFDCGEVLKSLKVYGALAGKFTNGFTGVFSGTHAISGYPYNLVYDNRLEVSEPPHFLNPIEAAWYIQRETAP